MRTARQPDRMWPRRLVRTNEVYIEGALGRLLGGRSENRRIDSTHAGGSVEGIECQFVRNERKTKAKGEDNADKRMS